MEGFGEWGWGWPLTVRLGRPLPVSPEGRSPLVCGDWRNRPAAGKRAAQGASKLGPAAGGVEDSAGGISGSKSKGSRNALSLRFFFFFFLKPEENFQDPSADTLIY